MKKLITSLIIFLTVVSLHATDFTYEGINYTILNEAEKVCQIKAGVLSDYGTVSGNNITGDITIPSKVEYLSNTYTVVAIGDYAFSGCSGLTSVIIPETVSTIGVAAFAETGLTSVNIGNSVTIIGRNAFFKCSGLSMVTIPNSVTAIGMDAFYECNSLVSVDIGDSVETISDAAFANCSNLASITMPNSVHVISDYAFQNCTGLTSIKLPESVYYIGKSVFIGCSGLTSIKIPDSITEIPTGTFYDCSSLTTVDLGNSITSIGSTAFGQCSSLTSIVIPNSVTAIGSNAFQNCSGLISVTIGNSVTTIGYGAFYNCPMIEQITCYAVNPPQCNVVCFDSDIVESVTLYVPAECAEKYKAAPVWQDFKNIEEMEAPEVAEIRLDKTEATIKVGETLQLTATVFPAAEAGLTWSSSDESVATVSATGLVAAVSLGTATITVTSGNITATCTVEVSDHSGIDGVLVDGNDNVEVYTLQGVRLNISTRDELSKLTTGFYIVNGKKVFVK